MDTMDLITLGISATSLWFSVHVYRVQQREKTPGLDVTIEPRQSDHDGALLIDLEAVNIGRVPVEIATLYWEVSRRPWPRIRPALYGSTLLPDEVPPGRRYGACAGADQLAATLEIHGFRGTVRLVGVCEDVFRQRHVSKPLEFDIDAHLRVGPAEPDEVMLLPSATNDQEEKQQRHSHAHWSRGH